MYSIEIYHKAYEFIASLDSKNQALIHSKLEDLKQGNFSKDKALKGRYKGKFRKRAGNFRIIYHKFQGKLVICVIAVGLRKDIYD